MNFKEALIKLKEGQRIHRLAWKDKTFLKMHNGIVHSYCYAMGHYHYNLGILTSANWMEVGDDETSYEFLDALDLLKEKKNIRYHQWEPDRYLSLSPDQKELWYHRIERHEFTPSIDCILASDWEIF